MIEDKLDLVFNKIEYGFDRASDILDLVTNKISNYGNYILNSFEKSSVFIYENLYNFYKQKNHDRLVRYLSLPWSVTIPIAYKYFTRNEYNRLPIFQPGMHMIRAKVGGGKSLTSFVLAEMTLLRTANGSYFTSQVEKPQLSEDKKYWYVHHRVIDLNDYYSEGKKVKNFNTEKYKDIHKDERHLQYNPRMNKGKKYNDTFVPEHEDHLLMRHEGMEHIYMYSQHGKLDSQDMDSITYMHEVQTIKDIPLKRWLDSGDLKYIPIKLKFTTYTVDVGFDGSMKRNRVAKFSLPIPFDVLARFDTHAEKYKYAGLPVDFK